MLLNYEKRTSLFVNQIPLNYPFHNRKQYIRRKKTPFIYSASHKMDEKISNTEHLNILNEYQDELKFALFNQKNTESLDNSQTLKDNSTRDSDIIICVDSKIPELKTENYENDELKIFKLQNNNNNENKEKVYNLLNLNNSLINKVNPNYKKISNLIDISYHDSKKNDSHNFKNKSDKTKFEDIKKIINTNDESNGNIKNIINKYYHFNFKDSTIEKVVEKINNFLIKKNNTESKVQNDSFNIYINNNIFDKINNKSRKDGCTFSNLLIDKINNNNYESALSLTNDINYFNSIKYLSNKFSSTGDKLDNNLMKALEENNKILKDFKGKKKEIADKYDLNMLKEILKNKSIRKKLKLNFGFLRHISEKQFYKFLDEHVIKKNSESLIEANEKNKITFENFNESINPHFSLFIYFLLGINYIEKSDLNLSEDELLSLISKFIKFNGADKNEKNKLKKRNKKMKLKRAKKAKKENNNIIRIDLEDIFGQDIKNEDN